MSENARLENDHGISNEDLNIAAHDIAKIYASLAPDDGQDYHSVIDDISKRYFLALSRVKNTGHDCILSFLD